MNPPRIAFQDGNPFPETPADRLPGPADLSPSDDPGRPSPPTVVTRTVDELRRQVDDYFAQPPTGRRTRGRAVALVGHLGIGKTHLTRDLARQIRERHPSALLWLFDALAPDLGEVYRDQIGWLQRNDAQRDAFEAVVRGYSADATAEQLLHEDSPGPRGTREEIAQDLREGRTDPRKIIEAFHLDDELVYREMRRYLGVATERFREFANALALLPDRDFKDDVWDWLSGDEPARPLRARGVATTISGTSGVLDTLAMFAFLYQDSRERCVLVLDSAEKVLDWDPPERDAFERLVDVYINLGGLLVFCIQPEPLSRLRNSLHDRIIQLWPRGLDPRQCRELVAGYLAAHRRALPGSRPPESPGLEPFTPAAFDQAVVISGGNPRSLLKLCAQSWRDAEEGGRPPREITEANVQAAAREIYERVPRLQVLELVRRAISELPWPTAGRLGPSDEEAGSPLERVQFEIFTGTDTRVCVAVFDSLLTPLDRERVEATVNAVKRGSAYGAHAPLVIVNGYLPESLRDLISQWTNTQPLVYDDLDFSERVKAAVRHLAERLATSGTSRLSTTLNDRVLKIAEQQLGLLESVDRIEGGLARVDRSLRRLDGAGRALPPAAEPSEGSPELPEEAREHFTRAFKAVAAVREDSGDLSGAFGADETGRAAAGRRAQRLAFDPDHLASLGVVALVERLLHAFQDNVVAWLRAVAAAGGPDAEQRHGIFVICRSFEITAEVLPLSRLGDLEGRPAAHTELSNVLHGLADRVYGSVLDSVDQPA